MALLFPIILYNQRYMTTNSERYSEFFVTARKYLTLFLVSCVSCLISSANRILQHCLIITESISYVRKCTVPFRHSCSIVVLGRLSFVIQVFCRLMKFHYQLSACKGICTCSVDKRGGKVKAVLMILRYFQKIKNRRFLLLPCFLIVLFSYSSTYNLHISLLHYIELSVIDAFFALICFQREKFHGNKKKSICVS